MGLSRAIDDANDADVSPSDSQAHELERYRTRAPQQSRKVLRLTVEIPVSAVRSIAFLLPVAAAHALLIWALLNIPPNAFARAIAPIMVKFLPTKDHELPPPDPPLLPAAALELAVDPLAQVLPPDVAIDAFEAESRSITTGLVAPKKVTPIFGIDEVAEEEGGKFVRPRPIRGRMGKQAYPSGAAAAGESGRATVKICIDARGTVKSVEITESTGFARLDNDALDIARQYRFRPATRNNKAIPVCMPYSINYRIN